jgi:hypothetical protein
MFKWILEPEETFAEDYSEKDDQSVNPDSYEYQSNKRGDNIWMEKVKRRFKETTKGVKGCPNKWNVHHSKLIFQLLCAYKSEVYFLQP